MPLTAPTPASLGADAPLFGAQRDRSDPRSAPSSKAMAVQGAYRENGVEGVKMVKEQGTKRKETGRKQKKGRGKKVCMIVLQFLRPIIWASLRTPPELLRKPTLRVVCSAFLCQVKMLSLSLCQKTIKK